MKLRHTARFAVGLVLLASLFIGPQASAALRTPLLHFYNGSSGQTAAGSIGTGDRFFQVDTQGEFSSGWTHTVHLPEKDNRMFTYNARTGSGAIFWLNDAGQYTTLRPYRPGDFAAGWTSVAVIGSNRLLFYRRADGLAALAEVTGDHAIRTIRTYDASTFGTGWTQVLFAGSGNVLFYNAATGAAAVWSVPSQSSPRLMRTITDLSSGWTQIVYAPSVSLLLYYNAQTGSLATARLAEDGSHRTFRSYRWTAGWTSIVPMAGRVLFYDARSGAAHVAGFDARGNYTTGKRWPAGYFAPGWTSIVYGF